MIDKIDSLQSAANYNQADKIRRDYNEPSQSDSVTISSQAKDIADIVRITKMVNESAPDVRQDRVNEVKERMKNPNYLAERIDEVADRILSDLLE